MADYGVLPTGFRRKPLSVILGETDDAMADIFGPDVIQTPQSPLGQINGVFSYLTAIVWELAEDVHQSYDPDQAEGVRLENLARIRLIERALGETDASLAAAITNAGVSNVRDADFQRALINVAGVTWARIWENNSGALDANGMPANSVTAAVLGGDDEELALIARRYIIPGITVFGNTPVDTNIDGYCRTIRLTRPAERRVRAEITVTKSPSRAGCPPPSDAAIAGTFAEGFTGANRPLNGEDITVFRAQQIISAAHEGVEITGLRLAFDDEAFADAPLAVTFNEIADVDISDVTVI